MAEMMKFYKSSEQRLPLRAPKTYPSSLLEFSPLGSTLTTRHAPPDDSYYNLQDPFYSGDEMTANRLYLTDEPENLLTELDFDALFGSLPTSYAPLTFPDPEAPISACQTEGLTFSAPLSPSEAAFDTDCSRKRSRDGNFNLKSSGKANAPLRSAPSPSPPPFLDLAHTSFLDHDPDSPLSEFPRPFDLTGGESDPDPFDPFDLEALLLPPPAKRLCTAAPSRLREESAAWGSPIGNCGGGGGHPSAALLLDAPAPLAALRCPRPLHTLPYPATPPLPPAAPALPVNACMLCDKEKPPRKSKKAKKEDFRKSVPAWCAPKAWPGNQRGALVCNTCFAWLQRQGKNFPMDLEKRTRETRREQLFHTT